jgi:hypothetical protein
MLRPLLTLVTVVSKQVIITKELRENLDVISAARED